MTTRRPLAPVFLSGLRGLGLVLTVAGCAPRATPAEPVDDAFAAPTDSKPFRGPRAESAAPSAEELAREDAPAAPRACGMPVGLYQPDWPRTLEPNSAHETSPFLAGTATVAVLPDTQYYVKCRNGHLLAQRKWIESQKDERNVRGLLTLGDLTESNTDSEWQFFKEAITPLDPSLPVVLALGNHDYGEGGSANRRHSFFSKYFEPSFAQAAGTLVETLDPTSLENAYYSIDLGRARMGVLVLEWSPRESVVSWANEVLSRHPELRTIVVTHAFLYSDDTRYDYKTRHGSQHWNPLAYRTAPVDAVVRSAHDGEMLWQELVKKHANVFLVLSGHVLNDGTGQLSSRADHGNVVHQLLSNYQMLDEGGLGYLRLLEFLPDGKTLRVKTYSPSLDLFATASDQDFTLQISPPLWGASR